MAIDREALAKQLQDQKAKREASGVRFLKKDSTTNLRIVEFTDENGNQQFARKVVKWRHHDQKSTTINRQETFGAPCAATRLVEMAAEANEDSPFLRKQTVYIVNAIDLDQKTPKMELWEIPVTVWEDIGAYLVTDEWADVLELESGHPFTITKSGSGLNTEYGVSVGRKPYLVSEELAKQIRDPFEGVNDPGLEGQCKALGVDLNSLFEDPDSLQMVEPQRVGGSGGKAKGKDAGSKDAAKPAAAKPAATPKTSKVQAKKAPPVPRIEVGSKVMADFDGVSYGGIVRAIDGDTAEVEFEDGNYDLALSDLTLAEGEAETEEPPFDSWRPKAGDKVEAQWEDGEFYPGTVTEVIDAGPDEVFAISWDDGSEGNVNLDQIRQIDGEVPDEEDTSDLPVIKNNASAGGGAKARASRLLGG